MEYRYSSVDSDELIECTDMIPRCRAYLDRNKCHKGDYCNKSHCYPREDKVLCRGRRTLSDCWFYHPGEEVVTLPDSERLPIVQTMGSLMAELRAKIFP